MKAPMYRGFFLLAGYWLPGCSSFWVVCSLFFGFRDGLKLAACGLKRY
jgi:hypothetical protein